MERDFNGYMPPFMDYGMPPFGAPQDTNDPMLNPIMQYEQAYSYYKYLCMQMDYKIKTWKKNRIKINNLQFKPGTNGNKKSP